MVLAGSKLTSSGISWGFERHARCLKRETHAKCHGIDEKIGRVLSAGNKEFSVVTTDYIYMPHLSINQELLSV